MKKVGLLVASLVLAFAVSAQTPTTTKKEEKAKSECCKSSATCDKAKKGECCKSKAAEGTTTAEKSECCKSKAAAETTPKK